MHFAFKCQQRVVTSDRVYSDPDIVFVIVINNYCCQLKINNIIDTCIMIMLNHHLFLDGKWICVSWS